MIPEGVFSPPERFDAEGRPLPPWRAGVACFGCALRESSLCLDCPRLRAERERRAERQANVKQPDTRDTSARRPWWRALLTKGFTR